MSDKEASEELLEAKLQYLFIKASPLADCVALAHEAMSLITERDKKRDAYIIGVDDAFGSVSDFGEGITANRNSLRREQRKRAEG